MKKSLKQALMTFGIMTAALVVFNALSITPVLAQLQVTGEDLPQALQGSEGDLRQLVRTLLNFVLGFLGLIAVVFVIYAGFLYVTAAGNDENIGKAKNIILYAIVGIIIILASAAIVNFALQAPTGGGPATTAPTTGGGGTL